MTPTSSHFSTQGSALFLYRAFIKAKLGSKAWKESWIISGKKKKGVLSRVVNIPDPVTQKLRNCQRKWKKEASERKLVGAH